MLIFGFSFLRGKGFVSYKTYLCHVCVHVGISGGLDFETGTSKQRYGKIQLRPMALCGGAERRSLGVGGALEGDGLRGGGEPTKQRLREKLIS